MHTLTFHASDQLVANASAYIIAVSTILMINK